MFILVGSFSMGGLRARLDIEGVGVPFLLALQSVLGSFQFLDALGPVYYPMVHRATRAVRFELGVSLVAPLLALLVLWVGWVAWERRFKALFLIAPGFLVYPFFGFEASISALSLLLVVGGLWFKRCFEEFFTGVFVLLCCLEALALIHWVVFIPLGLSSPLGGVAWVEMGLFYLSGYLAPLLVLPLLFMWVLRPLVEWGWGKKVDSINKTTLERKGVSRRGLLFLALSLC